MFSHISQGPVNQAVVPRGPIVINERLVEEQDKKCFQLLEYLKKK